MKNNFKIQHGRVIEARNMLLVENAFYASILLNLTFKESNEIKTFSINSKELLYNPKFSESLSLKTIKVVLKHEVMHLILKHHLRATKISDYDHNAFNDAADLAINSSLWYEEGFPEDALIPGVGKFKNFPMNLKAEKYYKMIKEEKQESSESESSKSESSESSESNEINDEKSEYSNPSTFGEFKPSNDLSDEEIQEEEDTITRMIIQGVAAAEEAGDGLPNNLLSKLDELLPAPKISWKAILRNVCSSVKKPGVNWNKPSRRNSSKFIMPSRKINTPSEIIFATDISGSIDIEKFNAAIAEVINSLTMMDEIDLWFWNTEVVSKIKLNRRSKINELNLPRPGGGTKVSCVANELIKTKFNPKLIIFFTDMDIYESNDKIVEMFKPIKSQILWIDTADYSREIPLGRTIKLNKV